MITTSARNTSQINALTASRDPRSRAPRCDAWTIVVGIRQHRRDQSGIWSGFATRELRSSIPTGSTTVCGAPAICCECAFRLTPCSAGFSSSRWWTWPHSSQLAAVRPRAASEDITAPATTSASWHRRVAPHTSSTPAQTAAYLASLPNVTSGPATDQSACPGTQVTVGPDTSCGLRKTSRTGRGRRS